MMKPLITFTLLLVLATAVATTTAQEQPLSDIPPAPAARAAGDMLRPLAMMLAAPLSLPAALTTPQQQRTPQ